MSSDSNNSPSFADLELSGPILKALEKLGYESPTPIQAASIPHLLDGRDILGQAQTGTGKTGAFALPLLNRVDPRSSDVQVLVLAPTRELAIQVAEAFGSYAQFMNDFHVLPIYGGQDITRQFRLLKRGAQVIVGTPGRVMDHMRRGSLSLANLKAMVLDEADEMLKMGFIDDIEWILEQTSESKQLALFSATMPDAIRRVANKHLSNPEHIKIKSKSSTVDAIDQRFIQTNYGSKLEVLSRVLEVEDIGASLIFVRTRNATVELAQKLEARGYRATPLNGDMNQGARERAIEGLKSGALDIIVATDVAARGIDVERISHVFNYDIPYDTEAYVHRIGRTGRAGRKGKAILLVTGREMRMLRTIERATKSRIAHMEIPSAESVGEHRLASLGNQLADTIKDETLDFMAGGVTKLCHMLEVDAETLASAMLFTIQRRRPLQPPELDTRPPRRERNRSERPQNDFADARPRRREDGSVRPTPADFGQASGLRDMPEVKMRRYCIEVGFGHGVKAGNIVGAIANEAGLDSQYIGEVKIYDDVASIDLPDGMPGHVFEHLKEVRVCGQALNITEASSYQKKSSKGRRPERGGSHRDFERRPRSNSDERPKRGKHKPRRGNDAEPRRGFGKPSGKGPKSNSDRSFRKNSGKGGPSKGGKPGGKRFGKTGGRKKG